VLRRRQAQRSVLAGYAGQSEYRNQGERVVTGQHLMQAVSDIFLGRQLAPLPGRGSPGYYYLRQLRDWKYSADIEGMNAAAMTGYGRLCGWTLAAPTPAPGTGSRSPPTSADQTPSTRPWPTSARPTLTRTSATTRHWPTRSPPGACKPRPASRPRQGLPPPNTDTSAVPPAKDADTPGLMARR
jgi:Uncharacterized protein conserved in bacteria (DUF2252)